MTATEKTLNESLQRLYADRVLARGEAPLYPKLSPIRDNALTAIWADQITQMVEALHEWNWFDIFGYIPKFGSVSTTIFRHSCDAADDIVSYAQHVANDAFDTLWARINDTAAHTGYPADDVKIIIEDATDSNERLISHPNYPEFYLRVSVVTSVMYQSNDYFVHEFTIRHGGMPGKQYKIGNA